MKNEREQFEKLPEIMEYLRDVEWSELTQRYIVKRVNHYYAATFINGAWYAFQEQQKLINRIYSANEDSEIKSIIDGWSF